MGQRRHHKLVMATGMAAASLVSPAAAMPARIWANADNILLRCSADPLLLGASTARRVCNTLFSTLSRHSPYPVQWWTARSVGASSQNSVLIDAVITPSAQPASAFASLRVRKALTLDDAESEISRPLQPLATGSSDALAASVQRVIDAILPWRTAGRPYLRPRIRPAS